MTRILSEVHVGEHRMRERSEAEIKNEPMFFNAAGEWAEECGGAITQDFLARLLAECPDLRLSDIVVDTRVHMLMPGWYPCIPGFHHDDVPRLRADGQPYYPEFEGGVEPAGYYHAQHAMTIVGGTGSFTQFALGRADFNPVPIGKTAYAQWHSEVEANLDLPGRIIPVLSLRSYTVIPRDIVFFDARSWHQGVPATEFGWRFFARASWNTNRVKHCTNEIRRQVQVYLENPMGGW